MTGSPPTTGPLSNPMMITDENGSTNVKFSTIWRFMAALAMIMLTSVTGLLALQPKPLKEGTHP